MHGTMNIKFSFTYSAELNKIFTKNYKDKTNNISKKGINNTVRTQDLITSN